MNSTLNSIKLQLSLILILILSILGCERQVAKEIMVIAPPEDDNRRISDLRIYDIEIIHQPEGAPFPVTVRVNGGFPNPCDYKHNETEVIRSQDGRKITINISMERFPSDPRYACITAEKPYQEDIDLEILSPGNYRVVVNGISKSFRIE